MSKKFINKTFNNEFKLYLNFLIKIFPKKNEIKSLNSVINLFVRYNPAKMIYLFHYYVSEPYNDIIQNGNYAYFENKDFTTDLTDLKENSEYVLKTFNDMREDISKETDENKELSIKFLQNLTNLSKLYYE